MGVSSRNVFQSTSTSREAGVITWVQFLQGPSPKICDGKKSTKIRRNFWQLMTLIANISRKDQHIESRKSSWKSTTPTFEVKKLVYFGPQTKKLSTLRNLHPNGLFSGDYILALSCLGVLPLKFLHTLQIDQDLLAHTRRGLGVPPPKKKS